MSIWKPLRTIYVKTTNLTHGYQDAEDKLLSFYKLWAFLYDFTIRLDPAYTRHLKKIIDMTIRPNDSVLDIGCGTGLATLYAAQTAKKVTGIDLSPDMISKLKKKIEKTKADNIELIEGKYPDSINKKFDSIISSFALVHFSKNTRPFIYESIYQNLKEPGRLGLFSARGEIAGAFETKVELESNLESSGFRNISIYDMSDIYRIAVAEKYILLS